MQKMVVSLAIMFAIGLIPATSIAQGQKEINQQVAQAIADKLSDKYPEYTINVRYNSGVATLVGELYSVEQVKDATDYVQSLPGVTKVINNMKVVQQRTQIQAIPISSRRGNVQPVVSEAPAAPIAQANVPAVQQSPSSTVITQVSGQMQGATDFSQRQPQITTPAAPTVAAPVAPTVMAPVPTLAPTPAPAAPLAATTVQASYVESPQELGMPSYETSQMFNGNMNGGLNTTTITTESTPSYANPNYDGMPLPMGAQAPTAGRYDQPNVPNYAWPSYAAPNNYAEVNYPRLYCPQAAPYIGPFYPYPQVPMGWRKVTLEWHDNYWWLDFDDGTAKGPFSPLFRQPNPKRY